MRLLQALILLVLLLVAPHTHACGTDLDCARELANRAKKHREAEQWSEAAALYAQAFDRLPSSRVKFNEALCHDRGGAPAAAADAYQVAQRMGTLDEGSASRVNKRLASLRKTLAIVRVEKPRGGTVTVAHARARRIPATIHLAPGRYEPQVSDATGELWTTQPLRLRAGDDVRLTSLAPPTTPEPVPPPLAPTRWDVPLGWSLIGVGAAATIASIVTGGLYLRRRGDFVDSGHRDAGLRDEANLLRSASIGLAIAGGAVGIPGVVVLWTEPAEPVNAAGLCFRGVW